MTQTEYIDVTPHPRILGVLGDIEFQPWQCLAELVDNAFDEFHSHSDTAARPSVAISLPPENSNRASAAITVKDTGRGMSLAEANRAIRAGWSSNARHGSLGLFGMGFNISTARLGRKTTVRTGRVEDSHWIEVDLDLTAISRSSRYHAPYRLVPKSDPNAHGTTIIICDLKTEQFDYVKRSYNHKAIRDKLGDVYSYLLSERGFLLTINGKKVQPRIPCVWGEERYVTRSGVEIHAVQHVDKPLPGKKACMDCGYWSSVDSEVCDECEGDRLELRERRIWGWLGIQRYVHRNDYGIDFLRNGRKILMKDKRVFKWQDEAEMSEPEDEYPIDSKIPMGRIIGEIHCDHVMPNYQKTAFEFETSEWRQVIRTIRGDSPLRPKIAKRLGLRENQSPLALLYTGFRRNEAGLNYLIPGDGRNPLHEKAREWAKLFRSGDPDYQSDEIWYRAAYQHDNPVTGDPDPGSDDILPGLGSDLLDPSENTGEETPSPGSTPGGRTERSTPSSETLDERIQRYRDSATSIVDLSGDYIHADLGRVTLTAWAVQGGKTLLDREEQPVPVFPIMLRPPKLEVFIDTNHRLFRDFGTDMRDIALVEVAEFMRVRVGGVSIPLATIVADLKAQSSSPQLTPAAMADEAERLMERIRNCMVGPVSENPAIHWPLLTKDELATAQRRFAVESSEATAWNDALANGDFIAYAPAEAIIRVVKASPGEFLDGKVFKRSYAALTDPGARELVVERLINPLSDLALLEGHRPRLDLEELSRIRVSCRLIERDLTEAM
ncbi:ATP-binding protein [Nocardiopsis sp. ATB16-24]|uniref:ATP-binding protein n=1 Tax=Nocardiopsis sp. ATB16-24 TaxID=3019555 RepID=UPI002554FCBD|nr:ATP-binding protein [Nocardiopsis sp. ATB16-24]